MAKKSKDSGIGGLIYLLFFLLIFILGIVITLVPIIMLIGYLITLSSYSKKNLKGSLSDFWLSNSEKSDFKKVTLKLSEAINNVNKANKIGDSEGIARNKDGTFSLRGNRGKEIQEYIDSNQKIINQNNPIFQQLKSLPSKRWNVFKRQYARYYGFLFGTITWISTCTILIIMEYTNFLEGMAKVLRFPLDLFQGKSIFLFSKSSENPDCNIQWKIFIISAIVSIITFFLSQFFSKSFASKISPIPPTVTINNYNEF